MNTARPNLVRLSLSALTAGALAITLVAPATAGPAGQIPVTDVTTAAVSVTVSAPAGDASVNVPMPMSVQITPGATRPVYLQANSINQSWHNVAMGTTDSGGKATLNWRPLRDGNYRLRVVATPNGGDPRVVSNVVRKSAKYGPNVPKDELSPMKPGSLSVSKKATGRFRIGSDRVSVTNTKRGPLVKVTDDDGRVVWSNQAGKAFVAASRNDLKWVDRSTAGAFWPIVTRKSQMKRQVITSAAVKGRQLVLKGRVLGGGDTANFTATFTSRQISKATSHVRLNVSVPKTSKGQRVNSVAVTTARKKNTPVHGFGEQFQPFDVQGQLLPILVIEQGICRGEPPISDVVDQVSWGAGNLKTTYGAWPSFVTGQNRSFELIDAPRSGAFSFADMRRSQQVTLEVFNRRVTADLTAAATPKALVKSREAGESRPSFPDTANDGAILGLQGGTAKVRQIVKEMKQAGSKISAVWLQDWVGKRVTSFGEQLWWTWQLDKTTYPGWSKMVRDFKRQGIDVLTYINPSVIDVGTVNGQKIRNLFKEGERKGYLVKNKRGKTFIVETVGFPTAMVDLTNPKARDWYADIIADDVLGKGATGFMADFGEYLPFDAKLHAGTGLTQHNRYPLLWAQTVREGCERAGQPDCLAFFRSSYQGSSKYVPVMWAGDQMVNWAVEDGLASVVKGMLAGGVSGIPFWHSDIGGYSSVGVVRSPELNTRWAEMQAFGVMMRSHESNKPRDNEQIYDTPTTRKQFARTTQIFAALKQYRNTVIAEGERTGVPAMRHGWLVYPGSKAAKKDLQFFLGDHLLVAPVVTQGAKSVDVTLPKGTWRHIFTGKTYKGNRTLNVAAPIGTPAAFVKVGDPVGAKIVRAIKKAGLR